MERTGKCMCGAVTYTADIHDTMSACHCGMCRRWSSGAFFAVGANSATFEGEENLTVITSSKWAERGFCNKCGSSLFYRITAEGKMKGFTTLAFGTLDDQSGVTLVKEWYIDKKPEAYTFEGDREQLTEAEIQAMFGGGL